MKGIITNNQKPIIMKKTLFLSFLFCLLGMSLTFAQETDFNGDADFSEEEFRQKVDSVFQYMEYQGVDTGILIEHGFNFLNPRVFNGQNPDSVYSNKDILKTLYAGLYDSKVNNEFSLGDTETVFSKVDNSQNISILYCGYNYLPERAFKSGQLYFENEQIKIDDTYHWSPFDYDFCFAIALGKNEFEGTEISIPLKIDTLITNIMSKVATMEIKADNEEYEKVKVNSNWTHSFSELGEHWLTFRIQFDDGYTMECRTPIMLYQSDRLRSYLPQKAIETFSTIAPDREQSGGKLEVIYLNKEKTDGKFIRPLVIVGDINLSSILSGDATKSIDLKSLCSNKEISNKIDQLSQIYDIIYLKYNDDMDDLLRNGKLLRKALQTVNDNRFSVSDDTYVVGLGVGGVIARIGINMMESAGENHRVCKFIAVNSPFRGVNIPLSLQALMRHIKNFPHVVKEQAHDLVNQARTFISRLESPLMKELLIQRVTDKFECNSDLNTSWLKNNTVLLNKPLNCKTVSITSKGTNVNDGTKIFDISKVKKHKMGTFSTDLRGFTPGCFDKQVYYGFARLRIKIWKFTIFYKNSDRYVYENEDTKPIDLCYGTKVSLLPIKNSLATEPIDFEIPHFTYVPCFSALDMDYEVFNNYKNENYVQSSKFDKCILIDEECNYPNYTPIMPALARELVPHIEGQTQNVFGTTELTLENVPNISLIKYEWTSKSGNFKVISSSKNKAVLTPTNYSGATDFIDVTPKMQLVSLPEIERLKTTFKISSAQLSIKGNDYISPELGIYSLSRIPDDVTSITWTASNGVELTPYEDMTVGAKLKRATSDRWIQASFTSYGVTHKISKSLNVAKLDSISMKMVKHWRNKEEELDKYFFHIDIYPSSPIDEMDFCWYNTVNIYPKESDNGHGMMKYFGKAKITTEGDVGPCYQIKTDPIIPIKPIIPQFINELADIPVEPLLKGKNEAIVSMPKIGVDETAKGKVFCDVKDKFGTIYTVSYEVESKWSTIYCATPNPANSVITITKLTDGPDNSLNLCAVNYVTARLYNGQSLVREQEISENCNHIDVEDLPEGSYYLNVEENGRIVLKQTVIIKH